ncbi:MAG: ABC transporter ATP-binding protein [Chloroflexi bacterium]|nr:ABC transporter ATP-binding protein [Chloroflexota bacterium]MCL5275337.1 ABC transporter ATP-binding protein [Chloroflexota bacterium]
MSAVIRAENLTRRFGSFTAVDHVSFEMQSGEVLGYLGPNGSGKTTTIRMLLGLLRPSEGHAEVLGYDVVRDAERLRAQCGYMSQKFALYNELTVWENLTFYAGVYGVNQRAHLNETLALVGLVGQEKSLANALSSGWRQRLALAIALIHRPRLLFLDEPTSGVDPSARRAFWDLIYALAGESVTVLVTTHYMDEAEYCGRVGIMRAGRLLAMDTPSNLKTQALSGRAWDVFAAPLLKSLAVLEHMPGVAHAGLSGDHLRAITMPGCDADALRSALLSAGMAVQSVEVVEPSLEDVFLALAG